MIKKSITYDDYNGNKRTEDFYFNLSKAEIIEMAADANGEDLEAKIKRLTEEQNTREIYRMFKDIVLTAYGKKTEDGRRFIKSKELSEDFSQTEAFSVLISEFIEHPDTASDFINGIIPQGLQGKAIAEKNA